MDNQDYRTQLDKYIKEVFKNNDRVCVLEAGCGSRSHFDLNNKNAFIEGIDISPEALVKNELIHRKILGDIQTFKLQPSRYDLIVCWTVLEHLQYPEKALENLSQSLKKNGIMIIGIPNIKSFKGLITKYTPYKFHYWFYQNIYKYSSIPCETVFKWNISPNSLKNYADCFNLNVELLYLYNSWSQGTKDRFKLVYAIYYVLGLIVKTCSLNQISITETELIVVYKKKE